MGARQPIHQTIKLNGVFKHSLNGEVSWTNRFIAIGGGVHADTNNSGYWDIYTPTVGSTIPVLGGAARTVNAASNGNTGGILLNNWESLWYRLPIEAGNATVQANFLIVPYSTTFDPDEHWVMVAHREDDNTTKLADGSTIVRGEQSGTKDVSAQRALQNPQNQWYAIQLVAPGYGAVVPGAVAYGYTSSLRMLGMGANNESFNSGFADIPQPAAGTVIYDENGNPSGRTWRVPVAADRMAHLGDLSRGGYPVPYATQPLADITANQTLWWNANPQSINQGTWHITPYTSQTPTPTNWIRVATFQEHTYRGLRVFGGEHVGVGDFIAFGNSGTQRSSYDLGRFSAHVRGLPMVAFTPDNHMAAAAGVNGNANSTQGLFVKWTTSPSYLSISSGYSDQASGGGASSGGQFINLQMPSAGLNIPLLGTNSTRLVDATMGIPLSPWESLYYVPAAFSGGTGSVDAGWVVATHSAGAALPHNAVKVAQFLWERTVPYIVVAAPPFAGANVSGADYRGASLWFLGEYAAAGATPGPIGNLDTIGSTESYRAPLFGAVAAGATGLGTSAVTYPGWPAGYRISATPGRGRVLSMTGLIQFPVAGNLAAGNVVGFLPGISLDKNWMSEGTIQPNNGTRFHVSVVLRLVNATVAGLRGVQIQVTDIDNAGSTINIGAGGWLSLRGLDGKSLD